MEESYSIVDFIALFILWFLFAPLFICQFGIVWITQIMNVRLVLWRSVLWFFKVISLQAGDLVLSERHAFSCSMCD